jgi:hypothetical protein
MFEKTFKKGIVGVMAASMIFASMPALAATTINSFRVARDGAVADGFQYFAFNFNVLNPGSAIALNGKTIVTLGNGETEFGGAVKYLANNPMFAIDPALGGGSKKIDLTSGDQTKSQTVYYYSPIKFSTSSFSFSLSNGSTSASKGTLIVKKGDASLVLTPQGYADSGAIDTRLVLGNVELPTAATSANALPNGKYKAFFRGYNYATPDKKKKYSVDSSSFVNMVVLAKPEVVKLTATDPSATQNGVKSTACSATTNTIAGDNKVVIKWDGKNLTAMSIVLTSTTDATKTYSFNIPSPSGLARLTAIDADCLPKGSYAAKINYQNTADYKASVNLASTISIN